MSRCRRHLVSTALGRQAAVLLPTLVGSLILAAASAADAPPVAEAVPIWDGVMRPGATTELMVRVEAPAAGSLTIEARAAGGRTSLGALSRAYRHVSDTTGAGTFATRIPMPGLDRRRVDVSFTFDGELLATREVLLSPVLPEQTVVVVAAGRRVLVPAPDTTELHVDPEDLPFYSDSYTTVDLLVIDRTALRDIGPRQLAALERFVAGCGRLLVHDSPPAAVAAIRSVAGCGGRFVTGTATDSDVAPAAAALLAIAPPVLADPAELHSLLTASSAPRQVFGLLFGYLVLAAILLARRSRPALVLALPVAASVLAAASWSSAQPDRSWAVWAELESGARAGRFVALLQLTGNGYGQMSAALPPLTALPRPVRGQRLPAVRYQEHGPVRLDIETRLLDRQLVAFAGPWREPAPVALEPGPGTPGLVNAGNRPVTNALLAWRGDKYLVPELAPGERWQPDAANSVAWSGQPAEALFRQRALGAGAAVLLRAPLPGRPQAQGYLMVTR